MSVTKHVKVEGGRGAAFDFRSLRHPCPRLHMFASIKAILLATRLRSRMTWEAETTR